MKSEEIVSRGKNIKFNYKVLIYSSLLFFIGFPVIVSLGLKILMNEPFFPEQITLRLCLAYAWNYGILVTVLGPVYFFMIGICTLAQLWMSYRIIMIFSLVISLVAIGSCFYLINDKTNLVEGISLIISFLASCLFYIYVNEIVVSGKPNFLIETIKLLWDIDE